MREPVRNVILFIVLFVTLLLLAENSYADETLMERGRNLYDIQEYRTALSLFSRVIQEEPDNFEALDFAGWCCRYIGDWDKAVEYYDKALETDSGKNAKWVRVGLGEVFLGSGRYIEALATFQTAIEDAEGEPELTSRAMMGLAIAYENIAMSAAASVQELRGAISAINAERASTLDKILNNLSSMNAAGTDKETLENLKGGSPAVSSDNIKNEQKIIDSFVPFNKSLVLGAELSAITQSLASEDIQISDKFSDPGRNVTIYKLPLSEELLPQSLKSADIKGFIVEEYENCLFKVTGFTEFKKSGIQAIDTSSQIFTELTAFYTEQFGTPASSSDDVINSEATWNLPGASLTIQINVRLEDTMGVFITYTDSNLFERYIKSF